MKFLIITWVLLLTMCSEPTPSYNISKLKAKQDSAWSDSKSYKFINSSIKIKNDTIIYVFIADDYIDTTKFIIVEKFLITNNDSLSYLYNFFSLATHPEDIIKYVGLEIEDDKIKEIVIYDKTEKLIKVKYYKMYKIYKNTLPIKIDEVTIGYKKYKNINPGEYIRIDVSGYYKYDYSEFYNGKVLVLEEIPYTEVRDLKILDLKIKY